MATLLTLQNAHLAFGAAALLNEEHFALNSAERVCIVGRNGAGKSSLLKLLAGDIRLDDGAQTKADGVRVARLEQELPKQADGIVSERLEAIAQAHPEGQLPPAARVKRLIEQLKLPASMPFAELSGGTQRRALLAEALASEPDVLLLDEPTNHLDVESIEWLEDYLLRFRGSLVFVTHDRSFLRRLATRIIELDRGALTSWPGDYDNYLRRRAERQNEEAKERALFDKKLAIEEAWIRQGIEARRTRSAGRVSRLLALRREHEVRRDQIGQVRFASQQGSNSGKLVLDVDSLSFSFDQRVIVSKLTSRVMRGDRVAILGPNGCGKSTLVKLLLGELEAQSGSATLGTQIELAYFDQGRASLDENLSASDNVAEGRSEISNAQGSKHIIGYLQDFLFSPEQARAPIHRLSGGERNRLLLAKLFAKPHNLLVLDEPTNDLDVETLELFEELLDDYPGTVLLVSHDRAFVDRVATQVLACDEPGIWREYVGGFAEWRAQRPSKASAASERGEKPARAPDAGAENTRRKRLGFKEIRELGELPARIEALETRIHDEQLAQSEAAFFRQTPEQMRVRQQQLFDAQEALSVAYQRWEALEALSSA